MKNFLISLGLLLGLVLSPTIGFAEQIAVPTQSEWAAAKKTVNLPNAVSIAYSEMGNTDGAPLLLIHGYTDNSRSWSLIAPFLSSRHIYAIDLRGHGKSSAPECCYAFSDLAYDVYLFLNAMKIDKIDVVGHSLGSITAQVLAARYPEKVDKIVLVSSTVNTAGGPGTWMWDNIMPLTPPIDPTGKFMTDWYWNPNPVDETFIEKAREESANVPMQVWKGVLWGTLLTDLSRNSQLVKAPMMIFWGDQDQFFDASHQTALKAAFPNARYETFKGAGHNMFWEQPKQAADLINDFLK